jgi:hypothetical protein
MKYGYGYGELRPRIKKYFFRIFHENKGSQIRRQINKGMKNNGLKWREKRHPRLMDPHGFWRGIISS